MADSKGWVVEVAVVLEETDGEGEEDLLSKALIDDILARGKLVECYEKGVTKRSMDEMTERTGNTYWKLTQTMLYFLWSILFGVFANSYLRGTMGMQQAVCNVDSKLEGQGNNDFGTATK